MSPVSTRCAPHSHPLLFPSHFPSLSSSVVIILIPAILVVCFRCLFQFFSITSFYPPAVILVYRSRVYRWFTCPPWECDSNVDFAAFPDLPKGIIWVIVICQVVYFYRTGDTSTLRDTFSWICSQNNAWGAFHFLRYVLTFSNAIANNIWTRLRWN